MALTKSIRTKKSNNTLVNYVRIGTIAWVKTTKNEIRQCRLERLTYKGYDMPILEWKVAGWDDIYIGRNWRTINGIGVIYKTKFEAEHGSSNVNCNDSTFAPNDTFNVRTLLEERYGEIPSEMFRFIGCWQDVLSIKTIAMKEDGTMQWVYDTPFSIVADKNGVKITIPLVDFGEVFLTKEAALATYKPLPIFTFEDDDKPKTFTIKAEAVFSRTIEVKADTYEQAVEIAKNVLRKEHFNEDDNNGTQFT